jgi:hypothetical protein
MSTVQFGPIYGIQPGVIFNFPNSIVPQSGVFVPSYQTIHEVYDLIAPASRKFSFRDSGLMGENFVTNLLSAFSHVGSLKSDRFVHLRA